MTTYISKHFMSIQCVHSEFLHLTHHSTCTWQRPALQCLALPISAPQSPQPCSGCPKFTESIIPAHGYTCYPTRGIYLRHSWWNKWENWLKQEVAGVDVAPRAHGPTTGTCDFATQDKSAYYAALVTKHSWKRRKFYNINQRCEGCSRTSAR